MAETKSFSPDALASKPRFEVLVVDDVPEILMAFVSNARRINDFHVRVTRELDAKRALDLVRATKYDLIVSDYRMRDVNGLEILKAARSFHPEGFRALMSGHEMLPVTREDAVEAGIDAYLQKPFGMDAAKQTLDGFVHRSETFLAEARRKSREKEATLKPR